jgi:septum formation protein
MNHAPQIIYLASKSPRRRELLKQIGVHFELLMIREQSLRIDVDETPLRGEAPSVYVERITRMKADAGERAMRERKLAVRPVLSADTTVTCDGEILGKPRDFADAKRMLSLLSDRTHEVLTAVAVSAHGETHFALSTSKVTFAALSEPDIKRYLETGECLDKAGAYGIQGHAAKWISRIDGSYSGVMGLPLHETTTLLRKAGLNI